MATKNNLTTYFFPHLRRGLGAGIDPFEGKAKEKRASVDVKFKVKAQGKANAQEEVRINQKVSLYGPGDVLGFDPERMIIRVQPTSDDGNFIANNVPFVDFAEADFLWRYSATQEKGKWIPWLNLIQS